VAVPDDSPQPGQPDCFEPPEKTKPGGDIDVRHEAASRRWTVGRIVLVGAIGGMVAGMIMAVVKML